MTIIPSRTYTFQGQSGDYSMQSVDIWNDHFQGLPRTVTSQTSDVGKQWFDCKHTTTMTNDFQGNPIAQRDVNSTLNALAVAVAAPAILLMTGTVVETITRSSRGPNNIWRIVGANTTKTEIRLAVDVSRQTEIPTDYVDVMYPSAPDPIAVTAQQPVSVVLAGDFRRPPWATTTRMLTDDELLSVAQCATRLAVTPLQMLAILIELTGARQNAYHPEQFYGIANLSVAQLTQVLAGGPDAAAQRFLTFPIDRQLRIASTVVPTTTPPVTGNPVAIYLFFATGQAVPNAPTASFTVPTPLPARLQPLSPNGTTLTGADIAAHIDVRAATLSAEFARRLPSAMGPA